MTDSQPESLVAFLDADSAERALERAEMAWTAPHGGDDLFALDASSDINFDLRNLLQAAGRAIAAAVLARQPPSGVPGHPMTNVVRRWRAQRRFSTEGEVMRALRTVLPSMADRQMEEIAQVLADWQALATRVRMLHLYERHHDADLWHQLADRHHGVALRVACHEGTSFWQPHAVLYQTRRPQITTLQEQVEVLLGQSRHVPQQNFRDRLLTRSRAAVEEREWRCFRHYEAEAASFSDGEGDGEPAREQVPFAVEEVRAIYLGVHLPAEQQERVVALAAQRFPEARLFTAHPHPREFALDFTQLGGSEDPEAEVVDETPAEAPA